MSKKTFLQTISDSLPELLDAEDLVKLGLFKSRAHLTKLRSARKGIPFIRTAKARYKYFKGDVLEFLEKRYHETKEYEHV